MVVTVPRGVKMWVVRVRWEGGVEGGEERIVVERWMEEAVLGMARMIVVGGRGLGLLWCWCKRDSIWGTVTPARILMRSFP